MQVLTDMPASFPQDHNEAAIFLQTAEFAGDLSAVATLDALQELLCRKLRWLLDFDGASLAVRVDPVLPAYDLLDLSHVRAETRLPPRRIPLGEGWPGRVLTEDTPYFLEDLSDLPRDLLPPARPTDSVSATTRSLIALPLRSGATVIGSLTFSSNTPTRYSPTVRTIASLLAAQIGGQLSTILAHSATTLALAALRGSQHRVQTLQRTTDMLLSLEAAHMQTAALTAQLAYRDRHDSLTGLLNRAALSATLEESVTSVRAYDGSAALCYLDLDHFRLVNDALPGQGDALLQRVAELVQTTAGTRGTAARVGGDEFAILFTGCPMPTAVASVETLCAAIQTLAFSGQGEEIRLEAHAGIVGITGEIAATDLLNTAESACAVARAHKRVRVLVYHPDNDDVLRYREDGRWVHRLTAALREDRLCLYAQPIAPVAVAEPAGKYMELLLRMSLSDGRVILPGAFIPAAERYDLMGAIDRWVVHAALATIGTIRREQPARRHECYFINLSAASCDDPSLVAEIAAACTAAGVPPAALCFEITETAAMADIGRAIAAMRALRALGCSLALDDFGSGISTYRYLRQLPIQFMKVDGALVRAIADDPIDYALLEGIYQAGNVLGFAVVAEWIEDAATLAAVRAIGIDYGQGYGIGRPIPFTVVGAGDAGGI